MGGDAGSEADGSDGQIESRDAGPPDAESFDATDAEGDMGLVDDARVDRVIDVRIDRQPDVPGDVPGDVPKDVPGDVQPPVDAPVDAGADQRAQCDAGSGQHRCGELCVDNASVATCGSACGPCPVPANGTATCNGIACGISCDPNFSPVGGACVRACTPTCDATAIAVTAAGGRFTGTTTGASTSAGSCGGATAPELVYRLILTAPSDVFITTHGTRFNTVLYVRNTCCGTELACNNDADGRLTSALTLTALPAGAYDIFVDGAGATDAGAFTVDIYTSVPSINPGESCGRPARIANMAVAGTTCGLRDDARPDDACQGDSTSGPDAVYYFVLDQASTVGFDTCTNTCMDSVIYVRDICSQTASERACNDDSSCGTCTNFVGTSSRVSSLTLSAGVHYLVVDTFPATACGPFTVTPSNVPL